MEPIISLDDNENKVISNVYTIISNDGHKIEVDINLFKHSTVLNVVLEDKTTSEIPIDLPLNLLQKVIRYLTYIDEHPPKPIDKPVRDLTLKTVVSDWELEFINEVVKEYEMIYKLINASNYLGIQTLMDLCMAKLASLILFKNDEEMEQIVNNL